MCEEQPDLGEREPFVWNDFEAGLIDLVSTIYILSLQFLVEGVVYPQIDVAPPMTLLLQQQHIYALHSANHF